MHNTLSTAASATELSQSPPVMSTLRLSRPCLSLPLQIKFPPSLSRALRFHIKVNGRKLNYAIKTALERNSSDQHRYRRTTDRKPI